MQAPALFAFFRASPAILAENTSKEFIQMKTESILAMIAVKPILMEMLSCIIKKLMITLNMSVICAVFKHQPRLTY